MESVSGRLQSDRRNFFVDDDRLPLKFRIQPGLDRVMKIRLEDGIVSNGGLVIPKVPICGIVIIDPKSQAGRELFCNWAWNERPVRHFVSYDFVQLCIDEKRLLPLEDHALRREDFEPNLVAKPRHELSKDVQEKLALYLAMILPQPSCGNRSANCVYKELAKNKIRYPWVRDYDWQTFRDQYCKNKRFYDKRINNIVKGNKKLESVSARREVLSAKQEKEHQSNMEVEIPVRKDIMAEKFASSRSKRVRFNNTLVIERKRKFADDLTNIERKAKVAKPNRTLDEMLKASLPPIVMMRMEKSGKLLRRQTPNPDAQVDVEDVEIGRASTSRTMLDDIWANETFGDDGRDIPDVQNKTNLPQADVSKNISGTHTLELYQHSLTSYKMDLDDFRSAAALDTCINNDNDAEIEDEERVVELLGLPTELSSRVTKEDAITSIPIMLNIHQASAQVQDPEIIAIQELAQNTGFIFEEVQQKLACFSGDMNKTRDFFSQCRQLVNDLFAQNVIVGGAESASAVVPKHLKAAKTNQLVCPSASQLSFPARNTRARKAERAAKKDK
ncbi:hypothetical protein DFH11DRAFT_1036459 [Phellopilus nigrolimitatus]|nr:hypothetical protein DFH11DRAFT_1036459 [Phellopilus nigrolimitatus]